MINDEYTFPSYIQILQKFKFKYKIRARDQKFFPLRTLKPPTSANFLKRKNLEFLFCFGSPRSADLSK